MRHKFPQIRPIALRLETAGYLKIYPRDGERVKAQKRPRG